MKVTGIPIVICALETTPKNCKRTGRLWNNWTSGDHPDDSIIKICQNTEKSPGDLRKLDVIQAPVSNHQLTLVWKTLRKSRIIIIKVTVTRILVGVLGTVLNDLEKRLEELEIRGRIKTIQTTALLSQQEYLEESWEIWGDLSLQKKKKTIS